MKSKLTLSVLLLFFSIEAFSQGPAWVWAKRMGDTLTDWTYGRCITTDTFRNVYTMGTFQGTVDFDPGPGTFNLTSAGGDDIFISVLDSSGNFVWAKRIGGVGSDAAESLILNPALTGGIYLTGRFDSIVDFDPGPAIFNLASAGHGDIFILKLDGAGNFVWAKSIGGADFDGAHSISLDRNGGENLYITADFRGTVDIDPGPAVFNLTSAAFADIFVAKFDSAGNFHWAKRIGSVGGFILCHTVIFDSHGIYLSGYFQSTVDFDPGPGVYTMSSPSSYSIFVSKLDTSGNFIWAKAMGGGTLYNIAYSMALDKGKNAVYTTGYFSSTGDFDPGPGVFNMTSAGQSDIFISKLDSAGNFVWAKAIGSTGGEVGNSITVDDEGSGDIYTTGRFAGTVDFDPGPAIVNLNSNGPNNDIYVCRFDTSGNLIWAKSAGGTGIDNGEGVAVADSGKLYMVGYFHSSSISFGTTILTNADTTVNISPDLYVVKLAANFINDSTTSSLLNPPYNTSCHDVCDAFASVYPYGGTPPYTFLWSTGDTTAIIDSLCAGVYFVTITDFINTVQTDSVIITEPFEPIALVSTPDTTICANSITLTANSPLPNYTGHWEILSGCGTFIPDSLSATVMVTGLCDTNTFVWIVGDTLCTAMDVVTIIDSCILGMNHSNCGYSISIYPNPVKDKFEIEIGKSRVESVEIYDMVGEKVLLLRSLRTQNKITVDASNIRPGIYLVAVRDEKNNLAIKKLIKTSSR